MSEQPVPDVLNRLVAGDSTFRFCDLVTVEELADSMLAHDPDRMARARHWLTDASVEVLKNNPTELLARERFIRGMVVIAMTKLAGHEQASERERFAAKVMLNAIMAQHVMDKQALTSFAGGAQA